MTHLDKGLIAVLIMLTAPPLVQSADKPDWAVRCETEGDKRCSLVQNVFLAENQQRLAGLALSHQGKGYLALVSVPLGVDLPSGAQIQVDKEPPLPVPYQVCTPQGCHGALMLPQKVLKALQRAKTLILGYQAPSGQKIGVPFSLKDFQRGLKELNSTPTASLPSHRNGPSNISGQAYLDL